MDLKQHIEQLVDEDPQPRRGYQPGDTVVIHVDCMGLTGRDPHPPVIRGAKRPSGRGFSPPYSPIKLGVVAYYDKEGTDLEWELDTPPIGNEDYEGYLPPNYYYVATDHGFFVFGDYELAPANLGNIGNLPEPHCLIRTNIWGAIR